MNIPPCCKVLADEHRMRILRALRDGELCVCVLQAQLKIAQNLLSHHLAILRRSKLVHARRAGRRIYYSLNKDTVSTLSIFFSSLCNDRCIR